MPTSSRRRSIASAFRRRHHGCRHRRGQLEARNGVTITDAMPKALAGGVQKVLEEVSFNKATRGPDPQKMLKYAPLVNATVTGQRVRPVRPGDRGDHRKARGQARTVRPDRAEIEGRRDPGLEHVGHFDHAIGRKAEASRSVSAAFTSSTRCARCRWSRVIRGAKTNDETIATAVAYAKASVSRRSS